ncbi:uncharacterized protein [Miscanthus floridulus]|uniref:uncharacterized protein n=1 Tax=Miscanthus floridulus TaxID=154761 RepID=UPI003458D6FC
MGAPAPMTAETTVSAAGASTSTEAIMTEAGAPETAEAVTAEAGAPEVTTAIVMVARPFVQEAEMSAAEASAVPLAQGPPLLWESARETETQLAPLAARIKELEEELTRAVCDRDAFKSWAEEATTSGKALAGRLGAEESVHRLTKGALNEALAAAEALQIEAVVLRGTVEELGSEASRVAEASRVEAQRLKAKAEACQAETRRWELKAKGELRGLPSLT